MRKEGFNGAATTTCSSSSGLGWASDSPRLLARGRDGGAAAVWRELLTTAVACTWTGRSCCGPRLWLVNAYDERGREAQPLEGFGCCCKEKVKGEG
ncbi:uncharacterized protein DS421_13g426440 [Arachis hypogaea]|nr:uncharacterized protein DS421_13g426440 [Arachis hypogaea]